MGQAEDERLVSEASIAITAPHPDHFDAVRALATEGEFRLDPAEELARRHALLWIARRGTGAPLGYLLAWHVADELELLQLVVRADARRAGLGGALLDRLCAVARERAVSAVYLEVRASNVPALALYRSRGFEEVDRRRGYYADGEDALVLRWSPRGV